MNDYLNKSFDLENSDFISVIDELPLWSAPFGLKLLEKVVYKKNITAIDIGCGLGFPLLEIAMRLGNSCKVYGIDPWAKAVERAYNKINHYGITNVKIITGGAENIPLPDSSVDLIFSNNGINNVNDLNKTLSELSRIAKSEAQFVFTFNTDKTMSEFYSIFESVLKDKNLLTEARKIKDHIYEKRKPVEEIVYLLKENNFSVNEIKYEEFYYSFVDGKTMLSHFLIRLAFIESWIKIIPNEIQQAIFKEIEEKLNEKAVELGSIKLTVPFILVDAVKT